MRAFLLTLLLVAAALLIAPLEAAPPVAVARPRAVVELPAPIENVVVGGSGQYLIVKLKDHRQLAVIDIVGKRVVKVLPVDDDLIELAAGATKLVVLHVSQGVISRYQLGSWQRDRVASCEFPYPTLVMGCASEGPVFAGMVGIANRGYPKFLDLETLTELPLAYTDPHGFRQHVHASPDGQYFGSSNSSGSPHGFHLAKVDSQAIHVKYEHRDAGMIQPGPDGRVIYTGYGLFDSNCQPLGQNGNNPALGIYVPGVSGRVYLMVRYQDIREQKSPNWGTRASFHLEGSTEPIVSMRGLMIPDLPPSQGRNTVEVALPLHRRMYYVPNADAVVTIPMSLDRVVIERINLQEELERSDPDYLVLANTPPRGCERGKELEHQVEVFAKRGPLVYELQNAPRGMQVASDGLLTWTPPLDFEPTFVKCDLTIRDAAGKTVQQPIELRLPKLPKTSATAR